MLYIRITLLIALVAITGCRSTTLPNPVLQPVATPSNDDTLLKSPAYWVLTPSHEPHTYHSISQTTVRELSNSTTRQNTINISITFTISLDQSHTPLIISGHIDTVKFRPDKPAPTHKQLNLPLVFKGELTPTALIIRVGNSQQTDGTCNSSISSILGDLHAFLNTYPTHLTPNFTWRDSTLVTTCTASGIPTTRKTNQLFRVVGQRTFNTTRALLLQQLDSTYISGDGAEGNHQIHIEGVGTGTANIYISPITAVILGLSISEKLEITVTNSRKAHHFIQEVTQRVEATN